MKTRLSLILTLLIISSLSILPCFAQYEPYTQLSLPEGAKARLGKGSTRLSEIQYSPDGTRLAVASSIGIWLYDTTTYEEVALLTGHTSTVVSVSFSPDGRTLASGSEDTTVRVWDVATGALLHTLEGHTIGVLSVSFSPDGQTLASASLDRTIRVWDVSTGTLLHTLEGHTSFVYNVAFSPDGRTLASAGDDSTVRVWDVSTGTLLHTLEVHTKPTDSVSFSADSMTLVSKSSRDGTARLWDVLTGENVHTFEGHTSRIFRVVFSPDGMTLAGGREDGTVHLWDVATGETLRTFEGHTSYIRSILFSLDGRTLASGSHDGTILLWNLAPVPIEPERLAADVNGDGTVNIQDLVAVAAAFGETGETPADVNGDGTVNIQDLVAVAAAFGETAGNAPSAALLSAKTVQQWLSDAKRLNLTDATSQRGIRFLEQLLLTLTPKETTLLANYPNPFNPETWIPYQLAKSADVTLRIHAIDGSLVRMLSLGHKAIGIYQSRSRAAYWDGRNEFGESVASGVYFYTLTAGDFTATRKMLIRK